jgi:hypothetical protein
MGLVTGARLGKKVLWQMLQQQAAEVGVYAPERK